MVDLQGKVIDNKRSYRATALSVKSGKVVGTTFDVR